MPEDCLTLALGLMSELLNIGALVIDQKGGLASATPLACELLGYENGADLATHWSEVHGMLPLDPGAFPEPGKPVRLTRSIETLGAACMLRVEIHALAGEACPGLLVMLRDKHALDAIDINLMAASRMRTQAYLYGALSHDMKIPLNAMQITLELLADTLADIPNAARDEHTARGERHVAALRDEFGRLRSALDMSAGLARPPGGMRRQSFDLRDVVREVATLLRSQARRQDTAIETMLPENAVLMIGPADWVKQALLDIAVNRLEAMRDQGKLVIDVGRDEQRAIVLISADMADMPDETVDAAYQVRFSPAAGDGAFALNVARAVVESLGGEFSIERDAGTRVRLTLPLG